MGIATLLKFLGGHRQAILEVARNRQAVWLGLLFVLSTGFAREYDGEDLLHEPWHLLLPLGASLATSAVLFALLWVVLRGWRTFPSAVGAFRSFLGLYWMTAPLAWLYAIPVERFLSAADATRANLWLLAIVAVWRVALMVRVVMVVWSTTAWRAFFPVMFFADTVALVLIRLTPLPIVSIMGGIRLSESEQVLQATAFLVFIFGTLSWPIWLLGTLTVLFAPGVRERVELSDREPVSPSAWGLATAALVAGVALLPIAQPEQQRRYRVERALQSGRIADGLETMSAYDREAFPPHWDPPPRLGYGDTKPSLMDVMEALDSVPIRPWVRQVYMEKFVDEVRSPQRRHEIAPETFDRYLTLLERLESDSEALRALRRTLESQVGQYSEKTDEQQARIRRLLGMEEPDADAE